MLYQVRIESQRGGIEVPLIEQTSDFEYIFEYVLTVAGKYTLFVQYDNADIPGSPRQLVVEAAELDTTTTDLAEALPLTMLAGQSVEFTLQVPFFFFFFPSCGMISLLFFKSLVWTLSLSRRRIADSA